MSEKKLKIAILTNGFHNPMGTFSKGYRESLPFDKLVLFGGMIPIFRMNTPLWKQKIVRYYLTIISLKNDKRLEKLKLKRLENILTKNNIDVALAEFLNTGASSFPSCKNTSIPIISNVLGYEINQWETVKNYTEKYRKLAEYQSFTIPVAKDMIPKLEALGFKKEKIFQSPIGAEDAFYNITPDYDSHNFFALGRFTETKKPQNTILAFNEVVKKFPEAQLIFGGSGELLEECKYLSDELNISKNINFIGWINKERQKEILSHSFCFVQHSITAENGDKEGTPVAIIEASAAGIPVVSTIHAGIPDVIKQGETGYLVEENDWQKMGEMMIKLYSDRELAKEMGQNAKKDSYKNTSLRSHLMIVENLIRMAYSEAQN